MILQAGILTTVSAGSDYYVAHYGSDSNSGRSLLKPFRTIQAAASILAPGDTCYIREGTYRETLSPVNSGSSGNPITFTSYNNEKVLISGSDLVTGWSVYSGDVYQASMTWNLGDGFNQVFVDGLMVHRARWPNTGDDLLSPNWADGSVSGNQVSVSVSRPVDHWAGGTVYGLFRPKWSAQAATITASSATGTLTVSNVTNPWYSGTGKAYITGVFEELDTEGEWFLQNGTLYLWAPGSVDPAERTVEAKARKWCVNLSGKSYIRIQGIDLFAGTVSMSRSSHCELSGSTVRYQSHFTKYSWGGLNSAGNVNQGDNGVYINGDNNVIRNCVFEDSAGSGIVINGGNNLVTRCLIRNMDYSATYSCPLAIKGSTGGNQILFNTMHDSARDIIQLYGATADVLKYNHLYRAGRLCHDLGITYQWGRDGQGTVLAYNHIHDNLAPGSNPGIYNDNYSKGFINHHNVIWNCEAGVRLNEPHDDMRVYNNTLFNCSGIGAHTYNSYPNYMPAFWTYGNVSNEDVRNNLYLGSSPQSQLVDYANGDFRLQSGAAAIDAGVDISPYTDGYQGAAPDSGAYESGVNAPWTPGRAGGLPYTPVTETRGTSAVTDSSAILNGLLANAGSTDCEVWVVWGVKEGLMDIGSWDRAVSLGKFIASSSGSITHALSHLEKGTTYYYRFYAENSDGGRWSETMSFRTETSGTVVRLREGADVYLTPTSTRDTAGTQLIAGNNGSSVGDDKRVFLKFDISSIRPEWQIEEARIRLYHVEGASDTHGNATLLHVTNTWDAATVLYDHPVGNTLGTLVGSAGPFDDFRELDVTSVIKAFQADPSSHAGFSIRGSEGFTVTGKYFISFEGPVAQRPEMLITLADRHADTDSDGMADGWETTTFGDLTTATAASDFDADGSPDVDEFKTGTDPKNGASLFAIQKFQITSGQLQLIWPSSSGLEYTVEQSASVQGPWIPILSNLPSTPPQNTLSVPLNPVDTESFFRVVVEE